MNKIIGFENEFEIISKSLIENKLNNSILINGNQGIGKFLFINKLIENYINSIINSENVNHHLSLFRNNSHPNIKILKKNIDEKTNKISNNITIDQIRELNHFFIETSIYENFPKFILIDSADDLNQSSANAILKILEEPKKNTYFFLISHRPSTLLPTIKSRCLKIILFSHNFHNFKKILINNNFSTDEEILKFLFDITNGSPGLSYELNFESILEIFDQLINSIIDNDPFSQLHNSLVDLLCSFDNEKFKMHLTLIKFILIVFKKIKMGIELKENYLSKNVLKIENLSNNLSFENIDNKYDYLINNQNDLFTFNLDRRIFMINFFAIN